MKKKYIYGVHAVESAIRNAPQQINTLWVESAKQDRKSRQEPLIQLAHENAVSVQYTDARKLSQLAGNRHHQGVVAAYSVAEYSEHDLYHLLDGLNEPAFLLILDEVTDPHNLGACLRTADAVGAHAVITPKKNSVGLTPAVQKVASGAADRVPLFVVTNLVRTLEQLKSKGIWLAGTSDKANQDLYETDLSGPLAVIMGAEGKGIRRLTAEHCDLLLRIPMQGQVSSLNVSVATGVCLYEALRQRDLSVKRAL